MWIAAAVAVVLMGSIAVLLRSRGGVEIAQVPFSDLLRQLDGGSVTAVVVNGDTLEFTIANGQTFRTVAPANYVTTNASFVPELARKHVKIDVRTAPEQSAYGYGAVVLGLGFVGLLGLTLYRVTTGRIPALES